MIKAARRVVVTGVGLVCPLGNTKDALWESLSQGRSGVAPLGVAAAETLPVGFGAEARQFTLEDAVRIVGRYVEHYNQVRLHSAIGYVAPADKLAGREAEIFAARDRKLAEARQRRKEQREAARLQTVA